jgi:transcriptional regulator with XRE-family HTH domain
MWQLARGAEGLGRALREQRLERGWTQEQLAEWLGVDRTTIVRMEAGRHPALARLADALSLLGADLLVVPRGTRISIDDERVVEPPDGRAPWDGGAA